jgi:hypothetical protein
MSVLLLGCCDRTHQGEVERREQTKNKKFLHNLHKTQNTQNIKYLHTYFFKKTQVFTKTQDKIFTQTPPNLKRHIVHNVTELT